MGEQTKKPSEKKKKRVKNTQKKRRKTNAGASVSMKTVGRQRPVKKSRRKTIEKSDRQKKKMKANRKRKHRQSVLRDVGITFFVTLLVLLFSLRFAFSIYQQEGYSMTQTISDGDTLFVNRLGGIRRNSLILFRDPQKKDLSVRRVIGLPGETIRYEADELYVNEEMKTEYYLTDAKNQARKEGLQVTEDFSLREIPNVTETVIPEGKYLVLGDNREFSTDSRHYGLVDEQAVIGVVTMRLLPLHKLQQF